MEQTYNPKQDYKVLVPCMTYNQSKFIEDALNGFALQQTNFPFVCRVMDDCSSDGEQDVIKDWMERECDISKAERLEVELSNIVIVPHKHNSNCTFAFYFLKQNLYGTGKKAILCQPWYEHSEYIAECEGDDYWCDPLKLQKQVDYMENNTDCGLVYTQADILHQATGKVQKNLCKTYHGLKDMLTANPIATLTVMFRIDLYNKYLEDVQPSTHKWLMGDYPMYLWFEINSKIGFVPDTTSVYRAQEESACHSKDINKRLRFIENHRDITLYFVDKYNLDDNFRTLADNYFYRHVASAYSDHRMKKKAFKSMLKVRQKTVRDYMRIIKTLLK